MSAPPLPDRTPVLVVGGGPVGLVVSALLSRHDVPHVLVERRREPQRAPAAHVLRRRPMRILDAMGVGEAVRREAPPLALDFVTWCTTLGGPEVGRLDLRPRDPATRRRAAPPWTNCPQNVLEPILLRHAARQPQARIVRGAECVQLGPGDGASTAVVRLDGAERRIRAQWVVAADGAGSPTRRALGIAMEGPGPLARFTMVHFAADLRPWIRERSGPIFWILSPESPGALIVHDPAASHVFMMPQEGDAPADPDRARERLAAALGVPVEPSILSLDAWSPHVQVAARYRRGRVLLVGDAAHRFPPTGGLGLNTGIEEAWELAAELARVCHGEAGPAQLDAYEARCRPAARANAEASFANLQRLGEIARVLGPCPDLASLVRRVATLEAAERDALAKAIEAQRSHFLCDGDGPEAGEPLPPPAA